LTSLPESLGDLANFTDLDLRKNRLAAAPESRGNPANPDAWNRRRADSSNCPPVSESRWTWRSWIWYGTNHWPSQAGFDDWKKMVAPFLS